MSLVVDTGVLVAAADAADPAHARCAGLLLAALRKRERLFLPALVLAEAAYLLESARLRDAVAAIVEDVLSGGYKLELPTPDDLRRALEIESRFAVGLTDATVAALAERLRCGIATLDRRHFTVLRTASGRSFKLLP